jgi:hypothetical protein
MLSWPELDEPRYASQQAQAGCKAAPDNFQFELIRNQGKVLVG